MLINFKKEITIYIVLFIISSLLVHNSIWFSHPIEHINALFSHGMPYHPFLYTFLIYLVFGIIRLVIKLIKKLFNRG
ncbi:hypothetical protein [Arcobacter arenosus]|uniref:hypothetical protein n=1 Tax=Arcobacter arenosus TaxID=2576037 RepID=UPI003BA980A9